jgi:signal transduction histidine kinase/CheY-like chemotaxis protein
MPDELDKGLVSVDTTSEAPVVRTKRSTEEIIRGGARAQLVILAGTGVGRRYPLDDALLIGRHPACQVWLPSDAVSRHHARIYREESHFVVEDQQSKNGTLVNGVAIDKRTIEFGDKISVGDTLMVFTFVDPLERQLLQVQKMEAVGRLAAGVAHEFNNLLSAILTNLMLLDSPNAIQEEQERQTCFEEAIDAAQRGAELTRQMLDFSRVGSDRARVDISMLVGQMGQFVRRTFGPGIDIALDCQDGLVVSGDRAQIYQALMNLCLNARDAVGKRGTVTITAKRCEVTTKECTTLINLSSGPHVMITVSDDGSGMSEEVLQRAFEPFFTTKPVGEGTGLGLSVVHGIALSHGGDVGIESASHVGTHVHLYLPTAAEEPLTSVESAELQPVTPLEGTVLLVDDDPMVIKATNRLLRSYGLSVITAQDGKQAVRQFEANRIDIDVVVLDMIMPVLGGAETFALLRRLAPKLPVIIATGYAGPSDVLDRLRAAGLETVLKKPFKPNRLYAALADILRRKDE